MADATLRLNADTRQLKKATKDLKDVERQSGRTEKATKKLTRSYQGLGGVVARAAGILAAGLLTRGVIRNTIAQEKAVSQLNAVLKSTGRFSEEASESLRDYAKALQSTTTFGDEAILGAQNLLLTFKQIGGEEFPRATKAILDMSIAMDQGLKESTIQLGKALNDPITGLTALQRVGITFSDSQKETIKRLQEMGDVAGAQRIILEELESQFEGSAEAARDTFGGALESLSNTFGDLLEADGAGVQGATQAINDLNDALNDPAIQSGFASLTTAVFTVAQKFAEGTAAVVNFTTSIGEDVAAAIGGIAFDDLDRQAEDVIRKFQEYESAVEVQETIGSILGPSDATIEKARQAWIEARDNFASNAAELATYTVASPEVEAEEAVAEEAVARTIERVPPAIDEENKARERTIELIKVETDLKKNSGATDLLRQIEFENSLIGKTNQQRETSLALQSLEEEHYRRGLELGQEGIEQNAAEIIAITEKIDKKYELLRIEEELQLATERTAEEQRQQAEATAALYRQLGNSASDALGAFATGSKTAKEAFDDFTKQVIRDLIKIAIQAAITKALGGSPSGGGFGDLFQGIFGKAVGGRIAPGNVYEVGERGPELITNGGRQYVVGGPTGGNVTPITKNQTNTNNLVVNLPPQTTNKTAMQFGETVAKRQKRFIARNG